MLSLVLTILCAVSIAALLRYNEHRGGDRFVVAGANYVIATIFGVAFTARGAGLTPQLLAFGFLVGIGFVSGFIFLMHAMERTGMAVPATTSRLSTLVPILGAMVIYDEMPNAAQFAGIGVGMVAFVLLGAAQKNNGGGKVDRSAIWSLVMVFVISGVVDFSMKIAQASGAADGPYLPVVFATAGLLSWAVVAFGRRSVRPSDLMLGAALGLPNFFASFFILRALDELPTVVVFPVMNAAVVVGVTMLALALWREVPNKLATAGLVMAAVAVLLLGLGEV